MKTIKTIIDIMYHLIVIIIAFKFHQLKNEVKETDILITTYQEQTNNYICELEQGIKERDTMIFKLYEPIVRLQLIAGIKDPDTTFTWIEKVVNPVDIKALIKHDFRKGNKNN